MTAPAKGPAAYLPGPTSTDLDLQFDLRLDKVPAGTGARVDHLVILRQKRERRLPHGGQVAGRRLGPRRVRPGHGETACRRVIGPDITINGITYAVGDTLRVRTQATGTSPTTLRVKVWKSTATEPAAWTATVTELDGWAPGGWQHRLLAVPRLVGDKRSYQGQVRQHARGGGEHRCPEPGRSVQGEEHPGGAAGGADRG